MAVGKLHENKVLFTKMFSCMIKRDVKQNSEDVFMHNDKEATLPDEEKSDVTSGLIEVQETNEDERAKAWVLNSELSPKAWVLNPALSPKARC